MADKIFCGNAKVINTKYGELTKISFSKKDLETMLANLSEKGWINTVLKEKKNKVEGKPTHYLEVDTFEFKGALGSAERKEMQSNDLPVGAKVEPEDDDDLPF